MRLILDAGAFIALARNDRPMWRRLKAAQLAERVPATHGGVVGQIWRGGGPRAALLAQALDGVDVLPLDEGRGRAAGELLGRSKRHDVIDAALVVIAHDEDAIVTSDPDDIEALARAAGRHIEIVRA